MDKGDPNATSEDFQLLGSASNLTVRGTPGVVSHANIMPLFNIYVSAETRDLGGVLADVKKTAEEMEKELPRGAALDIHGQAETMHSAYLELIGGLIASIVLIYLLIVVNFQSWLDPFIIITALPGALAGIAWALFLSQTNLSVPALTGAIMCMGTATANSVLVVSYARERLEVHGDAVQAALEAGIRPHPSGYHDRFGDDHRDAADVDGQLPECAAWSRRNWWPPRGDLREICISSPAFMRSSTSGIAPKPRECNESRSVSDRTDYRPSSKPTGFFLRRGAADAVHRLSVLCTSPNRTPSRRGNAEELRSQRDDLQPQARAVDRDDHITRQHRGLVSGADLWSGLRVREDVVQRLRAQVKGGDLLAEINTPTLDAQYSQAKAGLDAQRAKYDLAVVTAQRWTALRPSHAVSEQSITVQEANLKKEKAELEAAQHNVTNFEAQLQFKKIVAPYDGLVTARNINVGDYINKEGNISDKSAVTNLFSVADIHKMRLFISVPEAFGQILKQGLTADLTVPQLPNRHFTAKFLTVAGGFDPNTRTAVTEFTIDNDDRALWPGSYATVKLTVPLERNNLIVPSSALVFQEEGAQVGVVEKDDTVHFKPIKIVRILDGAIEVSSGVSPADRIIDTPSAALLDGDNVRVVTPARGYVINPQDLN